MNMAGVKHRVAVNLRAITGLVLVFIVALLATDAREAAAADSRSCAWTAQVTANQANIAYPDEAAKYWIMALPATPRDPSFG